MPFSRWFRPKYPPASRSARLGVDILEDRTVPSGLRLLPVPSTQSLVTHLQVYLPPSVQTGQAFTVIVEAENAQNAIVPNYTGIVHFSLGTADSGASLPANYVFTPGTGGEHAFTVTLSKPGAQTLKASDAKASISGSAATHVVQVATHFALTVPTTVTQGTSTTITVEALDADNHVVTGYTGTVSFFATDIIGLPNSFTFQASDHGSHQFTVTFADYGMQMLAAYDMSNNSVSGSANVSVSYNPLYIPSFSYLNGWGSNLGWNYW